MAAGASPANRSRTTAIPVERGKNRRRWGSRSSSSGVPFHRICAANSGGDSRSLLRGPDRRGSLVRPLGFHLIDYRLSVRRSAARDEHRANSHPERYGGHGEQDPLLPGRRVGECAVFLFCNFAEEHALIRPQQITRGEYHAERGPRGPLPMPLIRAKKNQVLSDESIEYRQAQGRKRNEKEKRGQLWHRRRQPAVLADFKRVATVV